MDDDDSPILLELLESAEEARRPPPLPTQGIPKQLVPPFIGRLIKELTLPFFLLDLRMQWLARKIVRPPFKKKGKCRKRGNCCHYVLIQYSKSLFGKLFYFWYTQIHGFYPRLKNPHVYREKKVWVMGCRYLKRDGSCAQYRLRPLVCRGWPVIEHFGHPRILKGCGFHSVPSRKKKSSSSEVPSSDSPLKILR